MDRICSAFCKCRWSHIITESCLLNELSQIPASVIVIFRKNIFMTNLFLSIFFLAIEMYSQSHRGEHQCYHILSKSTFTLLVFLWVYFIHITTYFGKERNTYTYSLVYSSFSWILRTAIIYHQSIPGACIIVAAVTRRVWLSARRHAPLGRRRPPPASAGQRRPPPATRPMSQLVYPPVKREVT